MTLTVPINFGQRQCDRLFIRALSAYTLEREAMLWKMFLVWMDYGTARDDRRNVPMNPEARATSATIAVLEDFIGWKEKPGEFIRAGIESGFFLLTPVSETVAELVLADFFPANANATRITNSEHGGISKSYRNIKTKAEAAAADQLTLFRATGGITIEGADDKQIKRALLFVHSVCQSLRRAAPSDEVWRQTILAKAIEIIKSTDERERESVIRWFIKNRDSQRIPTRLDMVLDKFPGFIPEAVQTFSRA